MKKSKLKIGGLAAVMCLCSPFAFAGTEATTQNYQNVDLGTGTYERSPFHVSVSVRGGFDDNVLATRFDPVESWFVNAGIALSYDFNSPRTQLVLGAGAGVTYYFEDIPGVDFDKNIYVSLALTHKASPRLTLSLTTYATYQSQPDFTMALGLNRRGGDYFYTLDKFTAAYLWAPRFSTATSYTLGAIRYNDSAIGFFEDRIEHTFGNEFRFLVVPTTSLVAEYRFQIVSYSDINNRDSWTHFALAGIDHSFSPRFNISLRGGAEFRDFDDNSNSSSPYFEGTLNYAVGKRTSVSWTNRYGIEESDVLLNQSRQTFRSGVRIKHDFTNRISATLAAYYQHDEYDGLFTPTIFSPAFNEDAFDVALAVRYAITRCLALEAGYNHTEVTSDDIFREYSRNRYFVGAIFTF